MSWTRLCALSDVGEESAIRVEVGGQAVCVARSGGRVHALRDVCSHAEVALSEGDVDDGTIECWLHGSRFRLETGEPTGLPANTPVATYAVALEGDTVLIDVGAAGSGVTLGST